MTDLPPTMLTQIDEYRLPKWVGRTLAFAFGFVFYGVVLWAFL
jgi:hypothetical protein